MVFSSLPVYLDPPNWSQQISHQPPTNAGNNQHPTLLPPAAEQPLHPAELSGPARPVSMAERARLAKIPQPEPALKCPRCDSTNTKFCYFNNYSLSQPRHFCKTCRRYWTRGGALRNVPVGGGCRRNKRTKASTSSKSSSSAASAGSAATGGSSSAVANSGISPTILPPPQLPFMTSFQPFNEYSTNIGLSFAGVHPIDSVDYQVGSSSSGLGVEQWRLQQIQQFPFLGGLDASSAAAPPVAGLFPFDGESGGSEGLPGSPMLLKGSSSGLISQLASVKMEDSSLGLNLQRQYLGAQVNDQYWGGDGGSGSSAGNGVSGGGGGGGWPGDLSGFNSSNGNIL